MPAALSPSARKVQEALRELGFSYEVTELPQTTRTATDAARAVGCQVGQIVKSLVFKTESSHRPILVIASGPNRVNEEKIAEFLSEPVAMADADFVRERTGFAIGGVPPVGHRQRLETFIDEDLLEYERVWAAAGTPNAVFSLDPADLTKMSGGRVVSIT
ncbi:MAG: YbaK/EbsC family protein [Anaerolineae bacterium]|jgi:Cys-tRNA(Pro) deacylase